MNGILKTLFIYLPFVILLMIFYWKITEIEVVYPNISVNGDDIIYDTNYKYKTTLIPFVYDFKKEGRQNSYSSSNQLAKEIKNGDSVIISISEMPYTISEMYIVYENKNLKLVYNGKYMNDITKFLTTPGTYRICVFSKLYKLFYYDGYIDYKFEIEVL